MKNNERILWVLIIIAVFLISFSIGYSTANRKHTEKENWYPMSGVVIDISEPTNTVTIKDFNNNLWQFKGTEDYQIDDCVAMIMDSQGTSLIIDDTIVSVKYDGWLRGWSK